MGDQTKYTIEGITLLKNTNAPIPYIQITLKETGQWSISNEKGEAVYTPNPDNSADKQWFRDPVAYIDFSGNIRPFTDYHTTSDPNLKHRLSQMRTTASQSHHYARSAQPVFYGKYPDNQRNWESGRSLVLCQ